MRILKLALIPCMLAACANQLEVSPDGGAASDEDSSDLATPYATTLAITLTGKPPAIGNSPNVTFTYSVTKPATIKCRLDGKPYASCPAPSKTFTGLGSGTHSFDLRATAGGKVATIPTYSFTIDTLAPALAITAEPASVTSSTTATFQFTAGDAVAETCQLDAQAPVACTSPWTYSGLTAGAHAFTLRGSDAAGNVAMTSYAWTISTAPPVVTITSEPVSLSNVNTPTFAFTASAGTTSCSLDLGPPAPCTSPVTYGPLADGGHTLVVSATDAAGNYGSAAYSWTIDATAPSVGSLVYTCDSTTGELDLQWVASDATSGIASGTCSYPAGINYFDCTNVRSWTGYLAGASTMFRVSYTDRAGNTRTASRTISSIACL